MFRTHFIIRDYDFSFRPLTNGRSCFLLPVPFTWLVLFFMEYLLLVRSSRGLRTTNSMMCTVKVHQQRMNMFNLLHKHRTKSQRQLLYMIIVADISFFNQQLIENPKHKFKFSILFFKFLNRQTQFQISLFSYNTPRKTMLSLLFIFTSQRIHYFLYIV